MGTVVLNPFNTNAHNFQPPLWQESPSGVMLPMTVPEPVRALLATPWRDLFIKATHEPREQFSASQLETAVCQYLWGLQYLIGLRKAELKIESREQEAAALARLPSAEKRERSLLFGSLLHRRLERYFRGEAVDWTDDVGSRALTGLGFLPRPGQEYALRIEAEISIVPNSVFGGFDIKFVGFVDLEDPEILYDYKSTGNFRWMKRPDELRENLAACLYALSSMQRKGTTIQKCRWVYFASVGKPEARAVDFTITMDQALAVVRAAFIQANGLRNEVRQYRESANAISIALLLDPKDVDPRARLPLIDHLAKNAGHCSAYGGCPMHYEAGGPCHPDGARIDFSDVKERTETIKATEQPKETHTMQTLRERLEAASAQQQQTAPATQQQVAQFQGFQQPTAPAQPGPAAFGAPPVQQQHLTEAPPVVQPYNPGGNPFQSPALVQPQAVAPTANPFAQQPNAAPAQQQVNPGPTPFAASSMPAQPGLPAFPGFGAPPVQQAAPVNPFGHPANPFWPPNTNTEPLPGNPAPFPGVNSPEASTAISADAAAAQPQGGKRKRRTKAEMAQASNGGTALGAVVDSTLQGPDFDAYEVTITIRDNTSGACITFGAPDQIADQMIGAVGPVLAGLR